MRKIAALIAAVAVTPLIVAAAPARQADVNYEIEVGSGETVTVENTDSPETGGTNVPTIFTGGDDTDCGADQQNRCDGVLAKFTGFGDVTVAFSAAYPGADYDLAIYPSDADGAITGEEVASSGNFYFPVDIGCDPVGFVGCGAPTETATWPAKSGEYYLIVIKYFFAGGGYTMDVSLG